MVIRTFSEDEMPQVGVSSELGRRVAVARSRAALGITLGVPVDDSEQGDVPLPDMPVSPVGFLRLVRTDRAELG